MPDTPAASRCSVAAVRSRAPDRSSLPGHLWREVAATWRLLSPEQRVAAVAALLLIVSTFGPFSFVEGAIVLVAVSVLALVWNRAGGRDFHLPFGDGAVLAAAGAWCAVLILVRVLDRPLGQNLLALGCALLLFLAGASQRAKRPADDTPITRELHRRRERGRGRARAGARAREPRPDWPTTPLGDPTTRPLPDDPPELRVPEGGRSGERGS
jgi:hypothetical protein